MFIKSRRRSVSRNLKVCINEKIEEVKETKYRGVKVDEHLNWGPHMNLILNLGETASQNEF